MGTFCPQLWEGCYINRSGEVFGCCHQKPKPYGNIHDAPLREVVNSPAARQIRADSLAGGLSCYADCTLLDKPRSVPWGHEQETVDYDTLKRLHISFGEACNIQCMMCDNPQRHRDNPILLDPKAVTESVDLTPFSTIMLRGGEPLCLRGCFEFMDHLEREGKRYTVLTNGLLIDERRALRLARHARDVVVSLNGATKTGHESVNRGSSFERVIENIRRLRRAREQLGSSLVITGHMTITTSNIQEVPLFLRTFHALGFDRANFGYVKETVPPYLQSSPEFASRLREETTAAMAQVADLEVDALRLRQLGLWNPAESFPGAEPAAPTPPGSLLYRIEGATGPATQATPEGVSAIGDPALELIRSAGRRSKAVAFLRHSERDRAHSPSDPSMEEIRLTEMGKQLARRFGRELPEFDLFSMSCTSIPRSQETAVEVHAGYREARPLAPALFRGKDPIFSVIYRGTIDKTARDTFRGSLRGQTFAQMWLDGEVPSAIMRPASGTVRDFLRDVQQRIREAPPSTLHVHIGHDREIEVVRTSLFGGRLADFPMMDFLDGIVFSSEDGDKVWAAWRDRRILLETALATGNPTGPLTPGGGH